MSLHAWGVLAIMSVAACGRTELPAPPPSCPARAADCDGDPANGCEVDLATDGANCGACGAACGAGLFCSDGACVPGETIVQIESMVSTVFVRSADGRVIVWGSNRYGLGNPRSDAEILFAPEQLDLPEPAVELRTSGGSTCARGASGRVWCWGVQDEIPSALPHDASRDFVAVPGVTDARVLMASELGYCVFDAHGRGVCWSGNGFDELTTGSGHPVGTPLSTAVEMSAVEVGPLVTLFPNLAAVEHGPILMWGAVGTLGRLPTSPAPNVRTPLAVPGLVDPVRVEAGSDSYCVSLRDGRVFCWGITLRPPYPTYEPILAFEHGPYKKIGASGNLCALDPAGHVDCNDEWNEDVDRDGVADLACGAAHLCLLMQDQRVLCKGSNSVGQLGKGEDDSHELDLIEVHLPPWH